MEIKTYNYLCEETKYIREEVFVKEQGFHNEFDNIDHRATHIVIFIDNKPVATCRIFVHKDKEFHLGRVAVLKEYRGKHLGNVLVKEAEECVLLQGGNCISLSAQCRVEPFYQKNGYVSEGDIYFDEHCEHIDMRKMLTLPRKPIIAITTRNWTDYKEDRLITQRSYMDAIAMCDATYISVVPTIDHDYTHIASMSDGLLLSGGADMHSSYYKEPLHDTNMPVITAIDEMDLALIKAFIKAKKPILGICRGFQVLNVYFNGTLYQDIPSQYDTTTIHSQKENRDIGTHKVILNTDSFLGKKEETYYVNSFHHQAVKTLGKDLTPIAYSEDGIIEAFEMPLIKAGQWHPECMMNDTFHHNILKSFIEECRK